VTGLTEAGNKVGGRISGCWQAIHSVALSGLAAPHSSQKNSSDDCCIRPCFLQKGLLKNRGFASPLYIIDEEQLEKQPGEKWSMAKNE
jgi:hypothetical protein